MFRFFRNVFLSSQFIFLFACQNNSATSVEKISSNSPAAIIQKKIFFENLPSASGLELVNDKLYVLSDDSPFLYVLDKNYHQTDTMRLFETPHFENGRIPTEVKYDPEALVLLEQEGQQTLLALGSGAKQLRERIFLIDLPKTVQKQASVRYFLSSDFYSGLKNDKQIGGQEQVNLEGIAADKQHVYLLPRTLKTTGTVLIYPLKSWLNYLKDSTTTLQYKHLKQVKLPEINDIKAGMSGAAVFDGYLFFTASVENTQNATLDGEVLGSFVGRIPIAALNNTQKILEPETVQLQEQGDKVYIGKAESLTILEKSAQNRYRAVVVSDDDQGHSEVMEVELNF